MRETIIVSLHYQLGKVGSSLVLRTRSDQSMEEHRDLQCLLGPTECLTLTAYYSSHPTLWHKSDQDFVSSGRFEESSSGGLSSLESVSMEFPCSQSVRASLHVLSLSELSRLTTELFVLLKGIRMYVGQLDDDTVQPKPKKRCFRPNPVFSVTGTNLLRRG